MMKKLFKSIFGKKTTSVNPYFGILNTQRIAEYKKLAEQYRIPASVARDIFNCGIDFHVNAVKNNK